MGPPSYMRSVVDRNVVMRRMTVDVENRYRSTRILLIHVGDLFVFSEIGIFFLKEETKAKKRAMMQCRCR